MTDVVDKKTRSRMMSGIRSKDTKPELVVRRALHKNGFRFRLHRKDLPGTPDIVLPKYQLAIFVHGCFWHRHAGCPIAYTPSTRKRFWQEKFRRNIQRDKASEALLIKLGWEVVVIWECQTRKKNPDDLLDMINWLR